ncbi:MAG: dihydrofolate reductase family protein [Actinomadura sp.]
MLNRARKYVVSRTMTEAPWENSVLKTRGTSRGVEEDLTVLGSGVLARGLMRRGLVDDWLLMIHPLIHPLVLGTGRRLSDGVKARVRLSPVTTTGP